MGSQLPDRARSRELDAGGTVSWVRYSETDDHLGMHHVYYRQQYHHPQLGRTLNVLSTAVSLHYASDGTLSRANLAQQACRHCGYSGSGFDEGKYMRVGLMDIGRAVRYDDYNPGLPGKALEQCSANDLYRLFAGDAMFYTQQTMEVFSSTFKRCGFDGSCGVARVVVDAKGGSGLAQFNVDVDSVDAPYKSVQLDGPRSTVSRFSVSASLDTVAHEWGHAVDFQSPGNFVARCPASGVETCEMMEGFAEVVGHVVERLKQTTADTNLGDDVYEAEHWDWTAQEDFARVIDWPRLRRADRYATIQCPDSHHSVHAEDVGCGGGYSANGNRLAVVLKLMTDGGTNPGAAHVVPCTGCDIDVTPLDPDADTSFEMAAKILFRVFDTEADFATVDWDELPVLARNAVQDLYWWDHAACVAAQVSTIDAFRAVGYPQSGSPPCVACFPFQQEPCCPPDYPCLGEPE